MFIRCHRIQYSDGKYILKSNFMYEKKHNIKKIYLDHSITSGNVFASRNTKTNAN
jgi:hypothetical protein